MEEKNVNPIDIKPNPPLIQMIPKRKVGRPPKEDKTPKSLKVRIGDKLISPDMTKEQKLAILVEIANSNDANPSDRIKAIIAHSEMMGENMAGGTKYIIKIEPL